MPAPPRRRSSSPTAALSERSDGLGPPHGRVLTEAAEHHPPPPSGARPRRAVPGVVRGGGCVSPTRLVHGLVGSRRPPPGDQWPERPGRVRTVQGLRRPAGVGTERPEGARRLTGGERQGPAARSHRTPRTSGTVVPSVWPKIESAATDAAATRTPQPGSPRDRPRRSPQPPEPIVSHPSRGQERVQPDSWPEPDSRGPARLRGVAPTRTRRGARGWGAGPSGTEGANARRTLVSTRAAATNDPSAACGGPLRARAA